jgi:GDPmannose 4,6-dehydratase
MKSIIFGINGQDGYYLEKVLTENCIEIIGVSRSSGNWIQGDVSNYLFVENLIKKYKPDYIFHLAANSTTNHSALFENHHTICNGTLNILESVYQHCPNTKVFLSGSAVQFENNGFPIGEHTNWSASNPYAIARIQSVYAGRYYRKLGLDVFVGYFFNHDSPLRSERHISQRIAQTIKRIANGSNGILEIGNIEVKKEFTFAGDVARAIWLLVNNNKQVKECVIGSGKAYSIKQWVEICCDNFAIDWRKIVKIKENFVPEYNVLVSDPQILFSLGWEQTVGINQLSELMLK